MSSMKGVTKIVNMGKSVARQTVRAVPVILPALTIAANVADIAATSGGDLSSGLNEFVKRYAAVDLASGRIDGSSFAKGGGSLIISGLVGLLLRSVI